MAYSSRTTLTQRLRRKAGGDASRVVRSAGAAIRVLEQGRPVDRAPSPRDLTDPELEDRELGGGQRRAAGSPVFNYLAERDEFLRLLRLTEYQGACPARFCGLLVRMGSPGVIEVLGVFAAINQLHMLWKGIRYRDRQERERGGLGDKTPPSAGRIRRPGKWNSPGH